MAIPTSYTEPELITRLQVTLRPVLSVIGWETNDPIYHEIVVNCLNEYGVTDLADASDINKLLKLARYFAWQAAVDALSVRYDYSDGGASYSRSQAYEQAKERYQEAFYAANEFLSEFTVSSVPTVNDLDVYRTIDCEENEE